MASCGPLIRAVLPGRHCARPRRHGRAESRPPPPARRPAERANLRLQRRARPPRARSTRAPAMRAPAGMPRSKQRQAPTPLIGEQQDAAVHRINAYFNNITNLQGNFEQIDSNNKRTTGRFYVQRPGKLRFDYAPPSTLRLVADGHFLAIEDSEPEDRREISARVDAVPAAARRGRRSRPRLRASSASRATTGRSPSRSRTRAARRPARSSSMFDTDAGDEAQAMGDHRRARARHHGDHQRRRAGPKGRGRLLHLDDVVSALPLDFAAANPRL